MCCGGGGGGGGGRGEGGLKNVCGTKCRAEGKGEGKAGEKCRPRKRRQLHGKSKQAVDSRPCSSHSECTYREVRVGTLRFTHIQAGYICTTYALGKRGKGGGEKKPEKLDTKALPFPTNEERLGPAQSRQTKTDLGKQGFLLHQHSPLSLFSPVSRKSWGGNGRKEGGAPLSPLPLAPGGNRSKGREKTFFHFSPPNIYCRTGTAGEKEEGIYVCTGSWRGQGERRRHT